MVPPTWSMCAWVRIVRRTGAAEAVDGGGERLPLRTHHEGVDHGDAVVVDDHARVGDAGLASGQEPGEHAVGELGEGQGFGHVFEATPVRSGVHSGPAGASVYPRPHVRTIPEPAPSYVPGRARFEREDARQGPGARRRHGVPRPRGLRRAAREGGRARQRGARHPRPRLGRHRRVRAGERVGHQVDLPRRHPRGRERRRAPRRDHAAEGRSTPAMSSRSTSCSRRSRRPSVASRASASRRRSRPRAG